MNRIIDSVTTKDGLHPLRSEFKLVFIFPPVKHNYSNFIECMKQLGSSDAAVVNRINCSV